MVYKHDLIEKNAIISESCMISLSSLKTLVRKFISMLEHSSHSRQFIIQFMYSYLTQSEPHDIKDLFTIITHFFQAFSLFMLSPLTKSHSLKAYHYICVGLMLGSSLLCLTACHYCSHPQNSWLGLDVYYPGHSVPRGPA